MSELGERLREARESQGISISQAAVETRILQRYLVALEDGDYQHLPGDVYARGFIRNYADYLSSPADELIELYRRERGMSEPIRIVPATSSPRVRGLVLPSFFGVFFVVLVLVGGSYLALSALPLPLPTPTPEPPAQLQVAAAATTPTLGPAGAAIEPTATPTAAPDAPILAEVSIDGGDNRGSWLEIKIDGETVFRKVLSAGQSLPTFKAQRDFWIRAGNAAVVSVVINGQKQCCTAASGEVQTFNWPPR